MVLWGGLLPIPSQVVADVITFVGLAYSTLTKPTWENLQTLVGTCVMAIAVSGNLTNKWTVIFPLVPFVILQSLRRIKKIENNKIMSTIIVILCCLLIVISAMLSVLFPAVELPLPVVMTLNSNNDASTTTSPRYQVGIIETFLPVSNLLFNDYEKTGTRPNATQDHVTVRILYPTLDTYSSKTKRKFLRPSTAEEFCRSTMQAGAPPPLKEYDWMVHNWRLITLPNVHQNAKLHTKGKEENGGSGSETWPVIVYSHGLGGTAELYTYQTVAMASAGNIVLVIEHLDGSGPIIQRKDGSVLLRDESVVQDWIDKRYVEYAIKRRIMVEHRAKELLAALDTFLQLNVVDMPELDNIGSVSFIGSMNTNEIHYMGHSFGGSSVVHAAKLRPPSGTIIAHEPVSDWLPDDSRLDLFDKSRLEGGPYYESYNGGTGGFGDGSSTSDDADTIANSLHDMDMLVLWSHEWISKGTESSNILLDMYERGQFGPRDIATNVSHVGVIDQAYHNEFSDTCMITPLWLARASKITGSRNPIDTAYEIHERSLNFLQAWKMKSKVAL